VLICPALAYCYTARSPNREEGYRSGRTNPGTHAISLAARGADDVELGPGVIPPITGAQGDGYRGDGSRYHKIFWVHVKTGDCMVPRRVGIVLRIGIERRQRMESGISGGTSGNCNWKRFFDDMYFLRELYKLKLEKRDAGGVAGVVKQMTQQYPDEFEPIYYGLKLAIITTRERCLRQIQKTCDE